MEVIKKQEQKTTTWAGGTTTELAIYPKESVYSKRNFKWRISSAKVELEQSTFTSLPGIHRLIMVLDGEMTLEHEGYHNAYLKPFEQDSFEGDWITRSQGKVRDFNLMLAEGCQGKLEVIQPRKQDSLNIQLEASNCKDNFNHLTEAFYCVSGNVLIVVDKINNFYLSEGDLLVSNMTHKSNLIDMNIKTLDEKNITIIRTSILYK